MRLDSLSAEMYDFFQFISHQLPSLFGCNYSCDFYCSNSQEFSSDTGNKIVFMRFVLTEICYNETDIQIYFKENYFK